MPGSEPFTPSNYLEMSILRYALKRYIEEVASQGEEFVDDPALLPDMRTMLARMEETMFGWKEEG
jgi:hypothetical protein